MVPTRRQVVAAVAVLGCLAILLFTLMDREGTLRSYEESAIAKQQGICFTQCQPMNKRDKADCRKTCKEAYRVPRGGGGGSGSGRQSGGSTQPRGQNQSEGSASAIDRCTSRGRSWDSSKPKGKRCVAGGGGGGNSRGGDRGEAKPGGARKGARGTGGATYHQYDLKKGIALGENSTACIDYYKGRQTPKNKWTAINPSKLGLPGSGQDYCGRQLRVRGPGGKSTTVTVVDSGGDRGLDLDQQVFKEVCGTKGIAAGNCSINVEVM